MRAIAGGDEYLVSLGWPAASLESTRLTTLANWTAQQKASSMLIFFREVAEQVAPAQAFLNTLTGTEVERAEAIGAWLTANSALLNGVTRLSLIKSSLKILPDQISLFTHVEMLDLRNNQLKELPASLGNLAKLGVLHLSSNQLKELPASLGNLAQLQALNLTQQPAKGAAQSLATLLSYES